MFILQAIKRGASWKSLPWILFIVALIIRLIHISLLKQGFYFSDYRAYENAALSLLSGHGFDPEYARPPLYPLFLAANYLIFGVHILAIRIVQALLGAYSCVLIYFITRDLFGEAPGRVAAWIAVFYPYYVFITGLLYPTLVTTFLLIVTIYFVLLAARKKSYGYLIVASICLAGASLAVPASLAFAPFLVIWFLFISGLEWKRRVIFSVLHILVVIACLAPWVTYCYFQYGKLILIDPRMEKHLPVVEAERQGSGYVGYENGERVKLIKEHPFRFLGNISKEFIHFWSFVPDRVVTRHTEYREEVFEEDRRMVLDNPYTSSLMNWVSILSYGPVFILAIIGIVLNVKSWRVFSLPLFLLLSHAFAYSLFFTQIRYRLPVEFCLMMMAGIGSTTLWNKFNRRKQPL